MDNDQIIKAYYSLKTSPEGQIILDDLQNLFYKRKLYNGDQTAMMVDIGAHDVVVYILSKIEEFELQQRSKG